MATSSYVLRALKILGPEEILKLSEVLHSKQLPLKKAAGEELIVWDNAADETPRKNRPGRQDEGKVLSFAKKTVLDLAPLPEEKPDDDQEASTFLSSDQVLWHRQMARQTGEVIHKREALQGYRKSTEMYVVKSPGEEGKDKIRFASTNGVLINKKQA